MSEEVLQIFVHHPWPGNVRQMHSVIRTAIAIVDEGERVERRHLPEGLPCANGAGNGALGGLCAFQRRASKENRIERIQETIRHNHGNISAAARQLGVSRTTLYRKLQADGIFCLPRQAQVSYSVAACRLTIVFLLRAECVPDFCSILKQLSRTATPDGSARFSFRKIIDPVNALCLYSCTRSV
jgi:transposase-like protein